MGDIRPENTDSYHAPHRVAVTVSNSSLIENSENPRTHPWGIFFTVLGTVLLDFDADACQSPARAYLLDVTVTGKHHMRQISEKTLIKQLNKSEYLSDTNLMLLR